MTKLIKVAFQKDMIKVNENGTEKWYDCEKAAKGFAKSNFKEATCNKENKVLEEGSEIELTIETRDNKPFVTQVRRPGQGAYTPPAASSAPAGTGAPAPYKPSYGQKTPEESEKITRLSVMSSATQAVSVLTGQIQDPNQLADIVVALYTRMLAEIKK